MATLLDAQLKEGTGDARETARALGPSAFPVLREHLKSTSADERSLVMECFAAVGGAEAVSALVRGLEDPDFGVRKEAVRMLHRVNGPEAVPSLRDLLSRSPDPWVRGNAALILGRMDDAGAVPFIAKQKGAEGDRVAAAQMRLALARLEDGEDRKELLARLSHDNPKVRYDAVADLEYVGRPELAAELLPLLADTRDVRNIGAEPFPVWHRVCDRAVDAVPRLTGKALPFPTGGRRYSPEEIQAARDAIRHPGGPRK